MSIATPRAAIATVAFGDKAAIARTIATKGAELKAATLESAILPMVSNLIAGNGTFSKLIAGKGHNAACPLQSAVAGLKGRAKLARDEAFTIARDTGKAADQSAHDEAIAAATLAIMAAVTPAPRATPADRVDWKARAEAAEARAEALSIDLAEARTLYAEAMEMVALARTMAPAPAPADSEMAPA